MCRSGGLKGSGVRESCEAAAAAATAAMGVYGAYARREATTAAVMTTTTGARARIDHLSLSLARGRANTHTRADGWSVAHANKPLKRELSGGVVGNVEKRRSATKLHTTACY